MKKDEKKLLDNTIMLYILTFSIQLLNFVVTPHLTRVLGPANFGRVGIAVAYMSYVQLILDMGFILSATNEVAQNRHNPGRLSEIFAAVTNVKLLLCGMIFLVYMGLIAFNENVRQDAAFWLFYILAYSVNALMPDFYYRGIEEMRIITMRTLVARLAYAVLVFTCIHKADQYILLPIFLLSSNMVAFLIVIRDLRNRNICWCGFNFQEIKRILLETFPYFCSRISSTVYQGLNTILLNMIYGGGSPVIGYYASADKAVALVKTGTSPIADSLFPYMVKKKNYKLIRKLMLVAIPIIVIGCVCVCVCAEPICIMVFGDEYGKAGVILRCLMPCALVIFPSYIICFPLLVPMGLKKYANLSNVVGLCVQGFGLVFLTLLNYLNVYSLCLLTSLTEVTVFLFRLFIFIKYRERLNQCF